MPGPSPASKRLAALLERYKKQVHSAELQEERRRLWESKKGAGAASEKADWAELVSVEVTFIGYLTQLAERGTIVQPLAEARRALATYSPFAWASIAELYDESAAEYPAFFAHCEWLDCLRLLSIEMIDELAGG